MSFKSLKLPKVYIPNKSFHDFSGATKYGELVFITEGRLPNRHQANDIARLCSQAMMDAEAYDFLLLSGPTTVNAIASAILGHKFGRLNYLLFDANTGTYKSRTLVLNQMEAAI